MQPHQLSKHIWQVPLPTTLQPPADTSNSYVIVDGPEALVVDCGANSLREVDRLTNLLQSLDVRSLVGCVATHHHADHVDGLRHLSTIWRAPIFIHSLDKPYVAKRWSHVPSLSDAPPELQVGQLTVAIHHEPGHTHGHLHVEVPEDDVMLVGDHLSGYGTVWIGPPDGHLNSFLIALDHIAAAAVSLAGPGHGPVLSDAREAAIQMKQRRLQRESELLYLLKQERSIHELMAELYGINDRADPVFVAAKKTIQGHLQRLLENEKVQGRFIREQGFVYRITES